jgi:4-azaleucine resistance transporter AzlC
LVAGWFFEICNRSPQFSQKKEIQAKIGRIMAENNSKTSLFWAGFRATLPLVTSDPVFGMLFGALGGTAGIPAGITLAMSLVVFAGSAQFIGMQLIIGGASAPVLLLTTLVVNLRHALYGLSLAPHMTHLSRGWKCLLAYLMTDETYAVAISRYNRDAADPPSNLHWFYLGSGFILWTSWLGSTLLGILFGSYVPATWGLDFAFPLTFIALVVPVINDRAAVVAALVGGVMAVLLGGLPLKLGLITAALTGILAGMAVDLGWFKKRPASARDLEREP